MGLEFLIRHEDLRTMGEKVQTLYDILVEAAQNCSAMIDAFLTDQELSGAFASSVKQYMTEVHKVILRGFVQVAQMLQDKMRDYLTGYQGIDPQAGFVLPGSGMEAFRSELLRQHQALCGCAGRIQDALRTISDLFDSAGITADQPGYATQDVCTKVTQLQDEILSHEQKNLSDLHILQISLQDLRFMVSRIQGNDRPDIRTYQSGNFQLLTGRLALMDRILCEELCMAGFQEETISRMERYGYEPEDLRSLYSSCETEADRSFLLFMAAGEYEKAFAADPGTLSEPMSLMIADHALRLYAAGNLRELEVLNNAVLMQTEGTGWFSDPLPGVTTRRQAYLKKLFEGSMVLLELNSSLLLQEDVTPEMKERNWNLLSMASLWNTQYHLDRDLAYRQDPVHPPCMVISSQQKDPHGISFIYLYTAISHNPFDNRREVVSVDVSADILETSEDLLNGMYLAERGELQEAADRLLMQTLGEGILDAGCSILFVAMPELGVAARMLETAIRMDTSSMDNRMLELSGKLQLSGQGPGKILLGEAIDGLQAYMDKNTELSDKISHLDKLYEGSMWGTGIEGSYTIPDAFSSGSRTYILSGIYNPDYLETIGNWNREGLTALLPDVDMAQIGYVMEQYPEYAGIGPDQLLYRMIYGFGEDNILNYPVSEIAEAKQILESIVREVYNGGEHAFYWNVEKAF